MEPLPLTPMQQGMLFETIALGRPWTNLQQIVCRLDHELDVDGLAASWRAAQERHPVLRSRFEWRRGEDPRQLIAEPDDAAAIPLHVEDWLDDPDAEERLRAWLAADRRRGVDPEQAPVQRLHLVRLGPDRSVLVWTFHHALLDGRSFTRVLEDVFDHYDTGSLSEVGVEAPFARHARAVAERLIEPERDYFAQLLKGIQGPTEIPIERAVVPAEPAPHATVERHVTAADTDALRTLADKTETTLYTCLLGAWSVLLSRYARTSDVVFGSTRSGRHLIEHTADTAGCLITTVPTRVDATADRTVADHLRAIRADQVAVRPFEQAALVDATASIPLPPGSGLLTTNVVFERYLMDTHLQGRGGAWASRSFEVLEEGGFDLSLAGYETDGLRLVIEYNPDRYPAELVEAMLGHLGHLLAELGRADGEDTLASLAMVPPAEARRLVDHDGFDPGPDACYPDTVEAAAARHPDRVAVAAVGDARALTYARFDTEANRLAHTLIEHGVSHGDRVAVCLPRGVDYAVAILAVHKAQAAFVPMDPGYPPQALAHMVGDSGAQVLLTTEAVAAGAELATPTDQVATLHVDELDTSDKPSTAPPRPDLAPGSLAYIIYTSGSTGVPKGVRIGHDNLTSHNRAFLRDYIELRPEDKVLQFAALSFDTSIEEITPTWTVGSQLLLRSDEMAYSLPRFVEVVTAEQVTVINLPTAFWHELVHHLDKHGARLPDCVRGVIVGGEKAAANAFRTWLRVAPDIPLINGYGPTECTISTTVQDPLAAVDPVLTTELPIGGPMANSRCYIVDDRGEPAPIGVAGELWVGGPCVGQGYHGLDELTAERFKPDPFHPEGDARVYTTGDLVRWLPTGDIEFLGRIDRQVKIRGFRIEPGQIEIAAEAVPAVAQAVVAARPAAGGGQQLVAWVRPEGNATVDTDAVRAHLQSTLPAHMVPSAILALDTFPVTAGGKVDQRALPDPEPTDAAVDAVDDREPIDDLERSVQQVFADTLGLDTLPLDASFFDRGGHSLLAIRLLDGIEQATGARLTLPALHQAPTPALLASALRDGSYGSLRYLLTVQKGEPGEGQAPPPIVGVHVLGVNNEYFVPLAERLGPRQSVYGLTLGRIGTTDLTDIDEIADAYAEELQAALPDGPVILAAVSLGSVVTLELARRLRAVGREVLLVVLFDARGPGGSPDPSIADRLRVHGSQLVTRRRHYLAPRIKDQARSLQNRGRLVWGGIRERRGQDVSEEVRLIRADRAHQADQEAHEIASYDGAVALFRADEEIFDDPAWREDGMGWSHIAVGPFHKLDVPGEHLSILAEPNVADLARKLEETVSARLAAGGDASTTSSP
ncbi:MAG: amino acid adenylation domain-containing protein [Actinomycetota bacterium]